jgi:hypothetical protein
VGGHLLNGVRDGTVRPAEAAGDVGAMEHNNDERGPIPDVRDRRQ